MDSIGSPRFRVETGTRLSSIAAILAALLLVALFAAPWLVSRGVLKDLFFVLTLIALAQYWNLLAGYAGIISIGQQAYAGFGGYLMFAMTAFAGIDPVPAIVLAGVLGAIVAMPTALLVFRLSGGLSRRRHLGRGRSVPARVRADQEPRRRDGRVAADGGHERGPVGAFCRRGHGGCARPPRETVSPTGWP